MANFSQPYLGLLTSDFSFDLISELSVISVATINQKGVFHESG